MLKALRLHGFFHNHGERKTYVLQTFFYVLIKRLPQMEQQRLKQEKIRV